VTARAGGREVRATLTVLRRPARPVEAIPSLVVTAERVTSLRNNRQRLGAVLRGVSPRALWDGPWRRPLPGRISAEYGAPRSYGGGAGWPHRGVDFAGEEGWPVVAVAPGVVVLARRLESYGNTVVVDHGQTVFTSYLHLQRSQVAPGDRIGEGQVLGVVGATGMATGPHLHFGAHIAGVAIDPLELLARGLP
jgi:murein DD-endopeptidase MepM/ murein hydrolase activator NlpD